MLVEKISNIGMRVLNVSAVRLPIATPMVEIGIEVGLKFSKVSVRKDNKAAKFDFEVDIHPSNKEKSSFQHFRVTFLFNVFFKEEVTKEEIEVSLQKPQALQERFLPFMDAFIAGVSKEMGMTPLCLAILLLKQEGSKEKS